MFLLTLKHATADTWLLWTSIFLRMFGFGLTNQVLVLFLQVSGIPEAKIGIFMTLTLVGDVLISYFLTWNADLIGRRTVLIAGTVMMVAAGGVFSSMSGFGTLLLAAIIGVISPSGDETGPFKTIEEASLAHLTPLDRRPEVFAFHGLFGTLGTAAGSLASGVVVDYFYLTLHWDLISAYRAVFVIYTFLAACKFMAMLGLSEKCEIMDETSGSSDEETPLIREDSEEMGLGDDLDTQGDTEEIEPDLSANKNDLGAGSTLKVASKLLVVFFLDSLGYGFMPASWVVYYFKTMFQISATILGTLFFVTSIINVFTTIPSAFMAKLLGPVKAILLVQVPSAIFFMVLAIASNFTMASILLVLYYATTTMDVVPRQVLLTSVVKKESLTKVMGTVNTVKTFARCIGPVFTGRLAAGGNLAWCFVISGGLTLCCDVVLAYGFMGLDGKIKRHTTRHN